MHQDLFLYQKIYSRMYAKNRQCLKSLENKKVMAMVSNIGVCVFRQREIFSRAKRACFAANVCKADFAARVCPAVKW
jgi:hypothetical protein